MFSFINFHFLFIRKKDGLTDGLLNNLVRYVIHCNEGRILKSNNIKYT